MLHKVSMDLAESKGCHDIGLPQSPTTVLGLSSLWPLSTLLPAAAVPRWCSLANSTSSHK